MGRIVKIERPISVEEALKIKQKYLSENGYEEDLESKEPFEDALKEFFALTDRYNINLDILPVYLDFFYCSAIARILDFAEEDKQKLSKFPII